MKKIVYTPNAADKLRIMKRNISLQYGTKKAKEIAGSIIRSIQDLSDHELKGPSVEKMFGITSDYRYFYIAKNYIFYRIEKDYIKIINIYHEKEDFMWLLFGTDTTPPETTSYWNE